MEVIGLNSNFSAADFIEDNIQLIDRNDWDVFVTKVNYYLSPHDASACYKMIFDAGIDILYYIAFIPENMFLDRKDLVTFTVPDHITNISSCAFYGCDNLQSITLSKSLTSIHESAFSRCPNLSTVFYNGFYDDETERDSWLKYPLRDNSGGKFYYDYRAEDNKYHRVQEVARMSYYGMFDGDLPF